MINFFKKVVRMLFSKSLPVVVGKPIFDFPEVCQQDELVFLYDMDGFDATHEIYVGGFWHPAACLGDIDTDSEGTHRSLFALPNGSRFWILEGRFRFLSYSTGEG